MMIKKITLFFLCAGMSLFVNAQHQSNPAKTNNFYVGLGALYSDFQDVKFSEVRYGGLGGRFEIGFNQYRSGRYLMEEGFTGDFSIEQAATHDQAHTLVFNIDVYYRYLRVINDQFMLGGRLDLTDINFRMDDGMGNNAISTITGSYLSASAMYTKQVFSENWKVDAVIDLSLISFQKETPSFAMTYSHGRIENNGVDYTNSLMGLPGYKYGAFKYFGNNFYMRTSLWLHYKKRFALGYMWQMRRFTIVEEYPTTVGVHSLTIRYNIVHRDKTNNIK